MRCFARSNKPQLIARSGNAQRIALSCSFEACYYYYAGLA